MSKSVKVYALSTCIHCKHCKEYLDQRGQEYDSIYVDRLAGEERNQVLSEIRKVNPGLSFPTVLVGSTVIIGFNKEELDKALEE